MNNFGTNDLVTGQDVIVQEMILRFITGALSLVFVGAFLTGVVGMIIWLTSGGNEDRNDSSVIMIKSSLVGMLASFLGYVTIRVFANFMGVEF